MSCINVGSLNVLISAGLDGRWVIDGTITLEGSSGVTQDTNFVITVDTDSGSFPLSIQVLSGNTAGNGQYDTGITTSNPQPIQTNQPCISLVDNNEINCLGFTCIGYVCPCEEVTQTPTPTNTPTLTITATNSPTPTMTETPTETPTSTPTPSITQTNTPTISETPTNTPTISETPTNTPTENLTPTPTPTASTTPSNTPKPTCDIEYELLVTPTPSQTSGLTPTPTVTPTITPTPSRTPPTPYFIYKNDCEPFVLFDLGIKCQTVKSPSSAESFDGALAVVITGGTTPYTIFWSNGQTSKDIYNLNAGDYEVTVIDYYGDYTATTICSLYAPTPSPTPTKTQTPTPSALPDWPSLCMIVYYTDKTFGPWQFNPSGYVNNKSKWIETSSGYTIEWSTTSNRWELKGFTYNGGMLVSTSQSNVPLGSWTEVGASNNPSISVTQGICPVYLPLRTIITKNDTSCNTNINCNGSISVIASDGFPPYQYSINEGLTYQNIGLFTGLCQQVYTITTKDSSGNTTSSYVSINATSNPTSYEIFVENMLVQNINPALRQSVWVVKTSPTLPIGTSINFQLSVETTQYVNEPGTGTFIGQTSVYKNSSLISQAPISSASTETNRVNCAPYITTIKTISQTYNLSISNGDIISGTSYSLLTITNPIVGTDPSCVTTLEQDIVVRAVSPKLNGCDCCKVIDFADVSGGINNHVLSYGQPGSGSSGSSGTSGGSPKPAYQVVIPQQPITPDSTEFSGGYILVNIAPVTLTFIAYGGISIGGSTKGYIFIDQIGDFETNIAYQYQSTQVSITIDTPGVYNIISMTGMFIGDNGNKVYLV